MITLKVTEDRLRQLKVGVWRRMKESEDAQVKFIAHFMVDESGAYYLPAEVALAELDDLSLEELVETFEQLEQITRDTAAPKV